MTHRQKFATQVEGELLARIRGIAKSEGRQVQTVVEDAFRTYLDDRQREIPRTRVMKHFQEGLERYATLYERLAK